jgi:hypothetical protein
MTALPLHCSSHLDHYCVSYFSIVNQHVDDRIETGYGSFTGPNPVKSAGVMNAISGE